MTPSLRAALAAEGMRSASALRPLAPSAQLTRTAAPPLPDPAPLALQKSLPKSSSRLGSATRPSVATGQSVPHASGHPQWVPERVFPQELPTASRRPRIRRMSSARRTTAHFPGSMAAPSSPATHSYPLPLIAPSPINPPCAPEFELESWFRCLSENRQTQAAPRTVPVVRGRPASPHSAEEIPVHDECHGSSS